MNFNTFRKLLGEDVYWKGSRSQFEDSAKNKIEYKDEIIVNYTQVENKEIEDLFSKGTRNNLDIMESRRKKEKYSV